MSSKKVFNSILDPKYSVEEYTPAIIYQPLGLIDGDPCAGIGTSIGSEFNWTINDDGMNRSWPQGKFLFVNPPFDLKDLAIQKCSNHGNCILLLPVSCSSIWWHKLMGCCDSVFVLMGRIAYGTQKSAAKFSTGLYCFGNRAVESVEGSGLSGVMLSPTSFHGRSKQKAPK